MPVKVVIIRKKRSQAVGNDSRNLFSVFRRMCLRKMFAVLLMALFFPGCGHSMTLFRCFSGYDEDISCHL